MIKRGHRQERIGAEGSDPSEVHKCVSFVFAITLENASRNSAGGRWRRAWCDGRDLDGSRSAVDLVNLAGRNWNLIVIPARRDDQSQLVFRVDVKNQRGESAKAILRVMNYLGRGRLEPEIAAVSIQAGVEGKPRRVPAAADLVIGLIEVSEAQDEIALFVPLKAGTRDDVEDSVGSVSIIRVVAAALDLEIIDVLRTDLRPHIAGNIRVRNGHAVNEPADLVPAADMKLIVREVGAGNVIRNHGQTVRAVGSRCVLNILAAQKSCGRDGIQRRADRLAGYNRFFGEGGQFHWEVQNGARSGGNDDALRRRLKIRNRHGNGIFAQRDCTEVEFTIVIGL